MRKIRQLHLYVGTLFAPAIIFFAFSGVFQTLSLHEAIAGHPSPAWIKTMASIHKDQKLSGRHKHDGAEAAPQSGAAAHNGVLDADVDHADAAPADDHAAADKAKSRNEAAHLPLKLFVVLMALGLMTSALLGVYIALQNRATRRVMLIMLAMGTALPVALLFA